MLVMTSIPTVFLTGLSFKWLQETPKRFQIERYKKEILLISAQYHTNSRHFARFVVKAIRVKIS